MITIRPADSGDVAWMLKELQSFAAFYGTKRSLFPADLTARGIVEQLVATQPCFVADAQLTNGIDPITAPAGFLVGALSPHPYNPQVRMLTELFWWVDPAYRGSSAGARLLEAYLAHGRQHADMITMTLESKSPIDDRVLLKRGFQLHERSYLLEV